MKTDTLYKYINDSSWAEVIRLYSGLFEETNDRCAFVINLADNNVLLAAECKNSSTQIEEEISVSLKTISFNKAKVFVDHNASSQAFEALLELNGFNEVEQILSEIKIPRRDLKNAISTFVISAYYEHLISFLANVINNDNKQNKNVLDWTFRALPQRKSKLISEENKDRYLAILSKLSQNNNRSQFLLNIYSAYFLYAFQLPDMKALIIDLCSFLGKKREIDKGQFEVIDHLIVLYNLKPEEFEFEVSELKLLHKEKEKERIRISDEIKKSLVGQVVKCKLNKMNKVRNGKYKKIAVSILGIATQPRGKQYLQISDLPLLINNNSGDIVDAKVIDVKYNQGDITLALITHNKLYLH